MLKTIKTLVLGATIATLTVASAQSQDHDLKPTIVLVHGAYAESSSWDAVSARLTKDGYLAIAATRFAASRPMQHPSRRSFAPSTDRWFWSATPMADRSSPKPQTAIRT
ncbi:dienelactone hydrolase [Rhizobium giardinii]|uniref:Dienelactone hydrolase n=1 Tax=Rhizobium giardinii TaxID=56731 RepID=A0A7W8X8I6_9HYPH|nr:dienelactone hydrolase [Rhizobium giardinii]